MNKYVIMANGQGVRWNNFNNKPKHLIEIDGETLLSRTVRLLHKFDKNSQIFITSDDERYEVPGAVRHEPLDNKLEIDRFTYELIDDNACFLYGDTYYTEHAIENIVSKTADRLLFIGTKQRIVAIKVYDGEEFKRHIDAVKKMFLEGHILDCKGWQVYQSFEGLPFDEIRIAGHYLLVDDATQDFNYPEDFLNFEAK